ncbi:MAG: outer membrane lipoprotein carrier protein LolA [Desulfobulbaceae bacterium]|nr:outer membrane lipoprotein carrier protein LolA [Desulfobulbaceae bacterium]
MNFLRLFFILPTLALVALAHAAFAAPEPADPAIPQPPTVQLQSVQANFFQEKHLRILAQPITSRGVFAFQAPRSLRWEYLYPVRTLLLVHGGSMKKLVEQDGRLVDDPGLAMDSIQLVLEEITNWLAGRFNDNPAFSATFPDEHTIVLTPKEDGLAAVINSIDLHLQGNEGLIDSVVIHEGPDTFTRLTFSDAVLNHSLEDWVFTVP